MAWRDGNRMTNQGGEIAGEPLQGKTAAAVVAFLFIAALIASAPLFESGWFDSDDCIIHMERFVAVTCEVARGDIYPRWLSAGCYGLGLPVLNFYSPLFYLVTGYLHALGMALIPLLKVQCGSLFLAGSWGMFLWVRRHCGTFGALVAATVYMFLPYHFLDLYVRGALPEFAALALMPYLFHALDLSFAVESRRRGIVQTAVTSAAIVLTHNLSALMIAPFAVLYFFWQGGGAKASVKNTLAAAVGPLLGLGLSAFYWLPVFAEQKYLQNFKETVTAGASHYAGNFLEPSQWVSPFWGYGVRHEGLSFQVGYLLLACVAIGAVAAFSAARSCRSFGLATFVLACCALFLTTASAAPLYELAPALQYIQFPWRFLGPATMFLAAFSGLILHGAPMWQHRRLPAVVVLVILALSVALSGKQRMVKERLHADFAVWERDTLRLKKIGVLGFQNEFFPRWASWEQLTQFHGIQEPVLTSSWTGDVNDAGSRVSFRIRTMNAGADTVVPRLYFPGWRAEVDGKPVEVGHTPAGLISLRIPPGEHDVTVRFGSTWPRIAGWIIAIVAGALIFIPGALRRCKRHRITEG